MQPPKNPVSLFDRGKERVVEADWARSQGYTLLDLSDDYVPFPFSEGDQGGRRVVNPYRKRYIDLANNRTDRDGRPLRAGRENHLELYGIPPSFSVLRHRFLRDERLTCFAQGDRAAVRALDRSVHYLARKGAARRFIKRARMWEAEVRNLMRRHGVKTEAELAAKGVARAALRARRLTRLRLQAILAAQRRLRCEGLTRPDEPIKPGVVDWQHHKAMVRFERKHMIFGWGQLFKETARAMARAPRENNHRALLRVLAQRIATDLPLIEDGSVPARLPRARIGGGRDLVGDFAARVARALGLETPGKALAFFQRRPTDYFRRRRVAVRLPARPAYHTPHMDLQAVIDRGEVWYDFPYDAQGKPLHQPIARRPHLTLYVRHLGRRIPLVRWPTTIGSWRSEVHRGCEYWKYKQSEVGERQWKFLVAGPVWMPPPGTPPRTLVARRWKRGRVRLVAREWEIGPGYASAYGLVAALHTREVRRRGRLVDVDGGIRTHGSVDYMSIQTRHSHGCHRLFNHLAVRLITFLLRHRHHVRLGPQPVSWSYPFRYQGKTFVFKRDHKGYYYRLEPPLPLVVTRGRIMGSAKQPITAYRRKANAPASCGTPTPAHPGSDVARAQPAPRPEPKEQK